MEKVLNKIWNCWTQFFLNAGLLPELASLYSKIFLDNRIQSSMLGDLDKEILKEMGIVAYGDIISILRYAKEIQDKKGTDLSNVSIYLHIYAWFAEKIDDFLYNF